MPDSVSPRKVIDSPRSCTYAESCCVSAQMRHHQQPRAYCVVLSAARTAPTPHTDRPANVSLASKRT